MGELMDQDECLRGESTSTQIPRTHSSLSAVNKALEECPGIVHREDFSYRQASGAAIRIAITRNRPNRNLIEDAMTKEIPLKKSADPIRAAGQPLRTVAL